MLEYFKPQDRAYGEIAVETISYVAQKGKPRELPSPQPNRLKKEICIESIQHLSYKYKGQKYERIGPYFCPCIL